MTYWKVKNTLSVATLSRICSRLQSAGCTCDVKVRDVLFVELHVHMPMNAWREPSFEQLQDLQDTFLKDLSLDRGALQPMEDSE